jgi:hypothetical protein
MLKKLLSSCLDSHLESEKNWVGEQSIPTSSTIEYQWTPGDWNEIIPSEVGWLSVRTKATGNLEILELGSSGDYPAFSVSTVSGHHGFFGASVPVRKGIPIKFKISGDVPTSGVYIRFHRIKGGT